MEPGSSTVFKAMLEREIHADITIKARGGSARAHRCVLACVSPVFEAMFRNQMEEQQTSVLKMPDMSIAAPNLFLKAIYCGFDGIDNDSFVQKWKEVFAACHKYDVPFQDGGTAFMEQTLSVDNCWEYLDKALLWTLEKYADNTGMVSVCGNYMFANCLEITEEDNFYDATIKYPKLVARFTEDVIRELLVEYT